MAASPKDLFAMMAHYNAWANERLYAAAAALSPEDRRRPLGLFFGSIHGTLNHLLVADRIWMHRFTGTGPAPNRLDAILFEDFSELHAERRAMDARMTAYVEGLDETDLAATFTYTTLTRPGPITQPLAPALMHVFNHQTHHRGQLHAALTGLGTEAPSFDLIVYQRESGEGLSGR